MSEPDVHEGKRKRIDVEMAGIRNAFQRLAFAFLSGGRFFWLFVVGTPLSILAVSLWIYPEASVFLFGIPALFGLVYWVSAYRYLSSSVTIDSGRNEVTVTNSDLPVRSWSRSVDLNEITELTTIRIADTCLVKVGTDGVKLLSIFDFVVPESDRLEFISEITDGRVDAPPLEVRERKWNDIGLVERIVLTPLILLGVPIYGVLVFGPSILLGSDLAIIAWALVIWTFVRSITHSFDVQTQSKSRRMLLNIAITAILIVVGAVVVFSLA